MRILHIEDDTILANLVKEFLPRDNVTIVTKLSDAINLLDKEHFDMMIADLHLDDSNADVTLSLLDDYDIPKVIVTVEDDEKVMEKALLLDHPPEDYILKQEHPGIHLIRKIKFNIEKLRHEQQKNTTVQSSFFTDKDFAQICDSISEPLKYKHLIAH
jgi:DNA-binding response OmpR family regulator